MREVRNGRRSAEMIWRRGEGIGSSGQVIGQPDLTSFRIYSGGEGRKR
jgi:hypothetical protein